MLFGNGGSKRPTSEKMQVRLEHGLSSMESPPSPPGGLGLRWLSPAVPSIRACRGGPDAWRQSSRGLIQGQSSGPRATLFQGQLPECQSPNQSGDREVAELPETGAMSRSLVYKL